MQNNTITEIPTKSNAYRISPMGIEFTGELSFQEWVELGTRLGDAGRCLGFLIGDWLNYGDGKGPRYYGAQEDENGDKPNIYTPAMRITGLDYTTLRDYASITRKIKLSLRNDNLSFDHHRKVAPLKTDEEKLKWLQIAEKERNKQNGKPMSARRLAKSILLGRVAKPDELSTPKSDRGVDNVHPHVNRLIAFWRKMKQIGFLEHADPEQIQTMIEDLQPVIDIVLELRQAIRDAESEAVDIEL